MTQAKTTNGSRAAATSAAGITAQGRTPTADDAPAVTPAHKPRPAGHADTPAAVGPRAGADADAARPKGKLVRDSFTIPKAEYAVLDALKLRAARLMRPTKKSEVLRAGIAALQAMDDAAFLQAVNGVPSLKTGRPKATPAPAPTRPSARKAVAK